MLERPPTFQLRQSPLHDWRINGAGQAPRSPSHGPFAPAAWAPPSNRPFQSPSNPRPTPSNGVCSHTPYNPLPVGRNRGPVGTAPLLPTRGSARGGARSSHKLSSSPSTAFLSNHEQKRISHLMAGFGTG